MERLKLEGTASEKRSVCLQEEFAASPDDTNVARTSMHCCCEQNTLSPSFMTKQRSSLVPVLRESETNPRKKRRLESSALVSWGADSFVPPG